MFRDWFFAPLRTSIHHLREHIMTTSAELAQGLSDLTAQVAKIGAESTATLQKVSDLEAAIAGAGGVDPSVQAAFDALKAQVQKVDDMVPDAAAPAPDDSSSVATSPTA